MLREAGVDLSCRPDSFTSIAEIAGIRGLELGPADQATIRELEIDLRVGARAANAAFNPAILYHPQLFVPVRREGAVQNASGRALPLPTPAALHPWGCMDERLQAGMGAHIPIDWRLSDWAAPTDPLPRDPGVWNAWVGDVAREISSSLWPSYDPQDPNRWNTQHVADLLEADFTVLSVLRENFELPIDSRYPTQVLHSARFVEEDDGTTPFGSNYIFYDPELPEEFYGELPGVFSSGMADKVGTLDLQLKRIFQRPRAHQVALLQDRLSFSYRWARTGNTPSMVSGHCLQGSIGGCTAWVTLAAKMTQIPGADEIFQQFVVDVGDRRVFAGVHYPSDNLASWYVAMRLIPRVFLMTEKISGPRTFLWNAIQRSSVYRAMVAHQGPGNSPYNAMLRRIKDLSLAGG
jgi:hypothetical protein